MLDQLDDEALERLVKKKQKEKELALQQLAEKEEKMLETEVDTPIIPPTPPKTPIQKFDNNEPPANEPEEEMTFLGHLEVLRWHLFRSAIAVVIFTVIAFITMIDYIFQPIIMGPSRVDFWTYRKLCELGEVLSIDALCIQKLGFTLKPLGQEVEDIIKGIKHIKNPLI